MRVANLSFKSNASQKYTNQADNQFSQVQVKQNEGDEFVKITKTQNNLNNFAWTYLAVSGVFGLFMAIANYKSVPKL